MSTTEYVTIENKIRTLRNKALDNHDHAELVGELTGLAVPPSAPYRARKIIARMLNETLAILNGAEFRPFRETDQLYPGQLVRLPKAAWDHMGTEVDAGIFEVVFDAPDDEGDLAVALPEAAEFTITDTTLEGTWVNARLFDVIDVEGDYEITEDDVPEEKPVLKRFATLTMPYPVSVRDLSACLYRVEPDWQAWVTSNDLERVELMFAHPDSMKGE